ncbi:MAG: glycosyltransferase family 39 protein, partial [Actinomycetota bacterium]|nr:glycosyltransferase family 39 protein [Actinomycetota bacterium]
MLRVTAVAAAVGGLVLRVWMMRSGWGVLDGDEAIVGLMARAILDGDLPTFLWGQRYGGTAESYVLAGVFGVAGSSTLGIRLVTLALAATAALLLWRIGRRLLGPAPGAAAGLLVWLWPVPSLFMS